MSTIIKFQLKELRRLANDKNSCVIEKKVTQNLGLQPWCLGNLKESVKNLLDYKIGKFDKEYNGILLSYKNLRILQNIGVIRNDNSDIHFQVQADYFIFRPHVGATLKGIVNKKSNTHLGILVHRVFNVVIPRPTEEPGNEWIGTSIEEGQEVVFEIVVLDLYGALPYIRGKLDERWLELEVNEDDDIPGLRPTKSINVSYVDFDKTKPIQKQVDDGAQNSIKTCHSLKNNISNGSPHVIEDNNLSTPQKIKSKKQNRNSDTKHPELNSRISKKIKKDC